MSELVAASSLVLEYLKREGVTAVFGIPGGPVTPLFDALYKDPSLRTIATRHESGAAFMACGYARMSGRLGVCFLTTGPGATNGLTAACAAKADGLPVLFVTAQIATADFGKGPLQDSSYDGIDTVAMFRPTVKLSLMPANAGRVASATRQAIRAAMTGRKGPVHLSLPTDLMRKQVPLELESPQRYRPLSRVFDREAVKEACARLLCAKKPAILAGHGVNMAGAQAELRELSQLLSIPVATTPKGKGAFSERHPLALRVFGLASSPRAESYLLSGDVDVLLVLGSTLHEMSTQGWDPRLAPKDCLIQADVEPTVMGRNYPVDVALVGDLKVTLRELLFALKRMIAHGEHGKPPPDDRGFSRWASGVSAVSGTESEDDGLIKPQRLLRELQAAMPEDAVICLDVGNHTLWATHHLEATGRNVFLNNWGSFAAMGYGVAGAVGAKLAAPKRTVVAVVGDGGFAMNGMEVLTAVTYDIPITWVVFNDARFNAVYHGQKLQYQGRTSGVEFSRMDLAAVARGLGAQAIQVKTAERLKPALEQALSCGKPCVVDVWIDADEVPPIHSRVRMLERSMTGTGSWNA